MDNTVVIAVSGIAIAQFGLIVLYVLSGNDPAAREKITALEQRLIDVEKLIEQLAGKSPKP